MVEYYQEKTLSVSSVRHFAENPARALDDWNGIIPWFNNQDALIFGNIVHSSLEDFLVPEAHAYENIVEEWASEGIKLTKKDGELYQKYADAKYMASVFKNTDIMKFIKDHMNGLDGWHGVVERGYHGVLDGVTFKGKPDVFLVNDEKKEIIMFDYKTSKPYPISGRDWGEVLVKDENGDGYHKERQFGSVVWFTKNLYPWQAGVYRELLRQNGYEDYHIAYRYIIATKEKEPRIDIWTMPDLVMDQGLAHFKTHLLRAHDFINGVREAPVVLDGSAWANKKTQSKPIQQTAEPEAYEVPEGEALTGDNLKNMFLSE